MRVAASLLQPDAQDGQAGQRGGQQMRGLPLTGGAAACGGARFGDGDHVLEVRQLARDLGEDLEQLTVRHLRWAMIAAPSVGAARPHRSVTLAREAAPRLVPSA